MSRLDGFLHEGFTAIGDTLTEALGRSGLYLAPATLGKMAARRFRASLKLLETLLRRLLVLMALQMEGAPRQTRPSGPARDERPAGPRARGFVLVPPYRYDPQALEALQAGRHPPKPGPVPAGPLLHRYRTLIGLLADPEPTARRMARRLARLRASGEAAPIIFPLERLHRLGPALGLIAAALPGHLNLALASFYDSG